MERPPLSAVEVDTAADAAPESEGGPLVSAAPPAAPAATAVEEGAEDGPNEAFLSPPAAASALTRGAAPSEAAAEKDSSAGTEADAAAGQAESAQVAAAAPAAVASVSNEGGDDDDSPRHVQWADSPMQTPSRGSAKEPRPSSFGLTRDKQGSVRVRDTAVPKSAALSYYRDCVALTGEIFDAIDAALHSGPDCAGDAGRLNVFEMFAVLKYIDVRDRAIRSARATEVTDSVSLARSTSGNGGSTISTVHPVVPARRVTGTQACLEDLSGRISLAIRLLSGGDLFPPLKLRVFRYEFAEVLFHTTNIRPLRLQASGEHAEPRLACFVGNRRRRLAEALSGHIDAAQLRAFAGAAWEENDARKHRQSAEAAVDLESRWPTIRREMTFKKLRKPDRDAAAETGAAIATIQSKKSFVHESHSDDDDTTNDEGEDAVDSEALVASKVLFLFYSSDMFVFCLRILLTM